MVIAYKMVKILHNIHYIYKFNSCFQALNYNRKLTRKWNKSLLFQQNITQQTFKVKNVFLRLPTNGKRSIVAYTITCGFQKLKPSGNNY